MTDANLGNKRFYKWILLNILSDPSIPPTLHPNKHLDTDRDAKDEFCEQLL